MSIQQLTYFVAVADEGSISAAARRLHVSQPPVTRQLKSLEAELGVELFTRTSDGMRLNVEASSHLEKARAILSIVRQLQDGARGPDELT